MILRNVRFEEAAVNLIHQTDWTIAGTQDIPNLVLFMYISVCILDIVIVHALVLVHVLIPKGEMWYCNIVYVCVH